MWHLVDREAMIELVYGGNALPMHTQVYLPNTFWLNDDATQYDFDPERSLTLLALAGWSRRDAQGFLVNDAGRRLAFTLATNAGNVQRQPAHVQRLRLLPHPAGDPGRRAPRARPRHAGHGSRQLALTWMSR